MLARGAFRECAHRADPSARVPRLWKTRLGVSAFVALQYSDLKTGPCHEMKGEHSGGERQRTQAVVKRCKAGVWPVIRGLVFAV